MIFAIGEGVHSKHKMSFGIKSRMTSDAWRIVFFSFNSPLWWKSMDGFPPTSSVMWSFHFIRYYHEWTVEQPINSPTVWKDMALLWCHCNGIGHVASHCWEHYFNLYSFCDRVHVTKHYGDPALQMSFSALTKLYGRGLVDPIMTARATRTIDPPPPPPPQTITPMQQTLSGRLPDNLFIRLSCAITITIYVFSTYLPNVCGGRRSMMLCCMQVQIFSKIFPRDFSTMHWLNTCRNLAAQTWWYCYKWVIAWASLLRNTDLMHDRVK